MAQNASGKQDVRSGSGRGTSPAGGNARNDSGSTGLSLLLRILNPVIFILLVAGLIYGIDLPILVAAAVVAYGIWGGVNYNHRRKQSKALLTQIKNGEDIKIPFDYGLAASLLNVAVLFILSVGLIKGWYIGYVLGAGIAGYALWFVLKNIDKKKMDHFNDLVERSKKSKSVKKGQKKK